MIPPDSKQTSKEDAFIQNPNRIPRAERGRRRAGDYRDERTDTRSTTQSPHYDQSSFRTWHLLRKRWLGDIEHNQDVQSSGKTNEE